MFVFVVNNILILYVEFGINFSVNMYVMIFYIIRMIMILFYYMGELL